MEQLEDVLLDGLKDVYSAESQLTKALPKMIKKVESESLREALENHLQETEGQLERLQTISDHLGKKLKGKTCKAMQGLIEEGKEALEEKSENTALLDCMVAAAAQRVEHYEIAAYESLIAIAEQLGQSEVLELLQETLAEESQASDLLSNISIEELLPQAASSESDSEDDDEEEEEKPSRAKAKGNGSSRKRK